jgi:hypothetical protein
MIKLKLTNSISQISSMVNENLAKEINVVISQKSKFLTGKIESLVSEWVLSQPEIISLKSSSPGSLAGQFGIPIGSSEGIVESIVLAIQNTIGVSFRPFDRKLQGGLDIYVQPIDLQNLTSLGSGHVRYQDGDLHWLNWLLTLGSTIIVANYHYKPSSGMGRSGLGVMSIGSSFRVPPKFSGTIDDNFVTRALSGKGKEEQITKIVSEMFI